MSDFISEINAKAYRGLNNLFINNLGKINLLVGDNNSGKTSLLEVIRILSQPKDLGVICATALSRNNTVKKDSFIDTVLTLFQKEMFENEDNKNMRQTYYMDMSVVYNRKNIGLEAIAEVRDKLLLNRKSDEYTEDGINRVIEGSLKISLEDKKESITFSIDDDISIDETEKIYNSVFMPVNVGLYKSCVALYSDVIKEDKKDDFIKILKIFDENITDISIVEKTIWIHSNIKSTMPLYAYGAGMQKALLIAITIVRAKGGVLLIDEMETAIHTSALKDVFQFIIEACNELNVQLFATTHSIEIIDKLLECQESALSDIRIITLTNDSIKKKSFARVLDGKTARDERKEYNLELRI